MKRIICTLILVIVFAGLLAGCSEGSLPNNTKPKKLYASIMLPNGNVVEGKVDEYHRYSEGSIEVHIDKTVYYVHSGRVAFIEGETTGEGAEE